MAHLASLLCLSLLVATLLLCVRIDKKGVLGNVELEEAKKAKAADAEAQAVLAKEALAAVTFGESAIFSGDKTWSSPQDIVVKSTVAVEDAKVSHAANAPGSPLAQWVGAFVADMGLVGEVYSLGGGGALIVAEKPTTSKEEANSVKAAKVAAAFEAVKVAETVETVHDKARLGPI